MAVYKLFPLQDAGLYSFYEYMNTGIDPIIEVGNLNVNINPTPQVFRYLVEFDQSDIENVVDNKGDPSYLGINYSGIIPYLVGAIKELNTNHVNETTQLKTEINSLKTTISTLESQFNILQIQMNTLLNQ